MWDGLNGRREATLTDAVTGFPQSIKFGLSHITTHRAHIYSHEEYVIRQNIKTISRNKKLCQNAIILKYRKRLRSNCVLSSIRKVPSQNIEQSINRPKLVKWWSWNSQSNELSLELGFILFVMMICESRKQFYVHYHCVAFKAN